VKRAFDYILDRDINCESIIPVMNTRKNLRIGCDRKGEGSAQKMDKTVNPLIAVPGAPGICNSKFLVHLPQSDEYIQCCGENAGAVVSTLTFKGGMK